MNVFINSHNVLIKILLWVNCGINRSYLQPQNRNASRIYILCATALLSSREGTTCFILGAEPLYIQVVLLGIRRITDCDWYNH